MDALIKAIHTTPIIDNHAHPLLRPEFISKYDLLSITTEAHGEAIKSAKSSLSHIRGVNQLSNVLGCEATWDAVVRAVGDERAKGGIEWEKRCFEGIETVLVDDGLDGGNEVYEYAWHDRLTRSPSKRIVRIEKVAENIITAYLNEEGITPLEAFDGFQLQFSADISSALRDPEVVGFKSVICYRAGLALPDTYSSECYKEYMSEFVELFRKNIADGVKEFKRIDTSVINFMLVNRTAQLISQSQQPGPKKVFQFHTGLGDNDITLTTSSPSHMQPFIRAYPTIPVVLLHASYPWTKEAGYLATVYENVYADIGEVFPFLSQEGQERVLREILELCPSEKICWSTDGHWFPETYYLAITQVREALSVVLPEYVQKKALSILQAIKVVENIFFNTSNKLYNLKLPLRQLSTSSVLSSSAPTRTQHPLQSFVASHPEVKYLRLQFSDYTGLSRLRVIPIKKALSIVTSGKPLEISIAKAALGALQNDTLPPGVSSTGEYKLRAKFDSLRLGPCKDYASVQGEFKQDNFSVSLCPRTTLRRQLAKAKDIGLEFLLGFEIEIVFLSRELTTSRPQKLNGSSGHAWCSARGLHEPKILAMLDEICDTLSKAGIELEQFHPEAATGQYEFVLPPLPPLAAVDSLVHAREIITTVAASCGIRATLHPKPFAGECGTASHVHISISSPSGEYPAVYEAFYAGVLYHLNEITAFTYSNPVSYERVKDGFWAGGRWVAWGTQNRETPLRKIKGSHWEIKCLDGMANVYLAMVSIVAAGCEGVREEAGLDIGDCEVDPASLDDRGRSRLGIQKMMCGNMQEGLSNLAGGSLRKLLGEEMVWRYLSVKTAEMEMLEKMRVDERWRFIGEHY